MKKKMQSGFYFMMILLVFTLTFGLLAETKEEAPAQMEKPKNGKIFKKGMGEGKMRDRKCQELLYKQLDLNEKQMEQLIELKKADMNENHKIREKMQNYRHLLHMAMMEENLDEKEISSLSEQIAKTEQEMLMKRVEHLKKLKEVLNKEQFKKMNLQMMMMGPGQARGPKGFDRQRGPKDQD